jgi:hypothetical protein
VTILGFHHEGTRLAALIQLQAKDKNINKGGMNMFVENYRQENGESIMAGGDARPIPYPKLSAQDWRAWKTFLPVRSQNIDKKAAANLSARSLYFYDGIPYGVTEEIQRATQYFDAVEVWRKREIDKDPIAVGLVGGERYLIARWGMEKLIPFTTIKKSMPLILGWKYATHPASLVTALAGVAYATWSMLM